MILGAALRSFLEQPPLKCEDLKDDVSQILEMKQYQDQSLLQETLMEDGCAEVEEIFDLT